jgi:hypothetical protein
MVEAGQSEFLTLVDNTQLIDFIKRGWRCAATSISAITPRIH